MGNQPSSPYVNIALSKLSYLPGEEVKGYVDITLRGDAPTSFTALDIHFSGEGYGGGGQRRNGEEEEKEEERTRSSFLDQR
eukprot:gene19112-22853_t